MVEGESEEDERPGRWIHRPGRARHLEDLGREAAAFLVGSGATRQLALIGHVCWFKFVTYYQKDS